MARCRGEGGTRSCLKSGDAWSKESTSSSVTGPESEVTLGPDPTITEVLGLGFQDSSGSKSGDGDATSEVEVWCHCKRFGVPQSTCPIVPVATLRPLVTKAQSPGSAPDGCGVPVPQQREPKASRVSVEGSSRLGDGRGIRRPSCDDGATRVSLGRTCGLPGLERRNDGVSMKSFPPDDEYEWPRIPSNGRASKAGVGKKVWNIANLAPASPSGGTTKGQSCPHCDSTLESRFHLAALDPQGRVILSPSMA